MDRHGALREVESSNWSERLYKTPLDLIERRIHAIRGHKVMIDSDLAELYGVATKNLNKAVRRNRGRFSARFHVPAFRSRACKLEVPNWNLKFSAWRLEVSAARLTEQGVAMLSSVLNSSRAIAVNIQIMRAFVQMRALLTSNETMRKQLYELERKVASHDQAIVGIFKTLHELMSPQQTNAIGFTAKIPADPQQR